MDGSPAVWMNDNWMLLVLLYAVSAGISMTWCYVLMWKRSTASVAWRTWLRVSFVLLWPYVALPISSGLFGQRIVDVALSAVGLAFSAFGIVLGLVYVRDWSIIWIEKRISKERVQ